MHKQIGFVGGLLALFIATGCQPVSGPQSEVGDEQGMAMLEEVAAERLEAVLSMQPEAVQARFQYRNPAETLNFFGIKPGMTVAEVLPGGGWYSRILSAYLGPHGTLIGINYPQQIWSLLGFMSEERIAALAGWASDWPDQAAAWELENGANYQAFVIGELPEHLVGTVDAVLMVRALHNLARFDADHGFISLALGDVYAALKPGGVVGVVQHEARPHMPDDWASGDHGYLKRDFVVAQFEAAGFALIGESDINTNPLDQPTVEENVWRLPPSLRGAEDDQVREHWLAVGESHRATLKFRKPN